MNKISLLLLACSMLSSASFGQKKIRVSNTLDMPRQEIISIPYVTFTKHFGVDSLFRVTSEETTEQMLHQLEKLGKQTPQYVLIAVSVPAQSTMNLIVTASEKKPSFPQKTFARFVPERFDDFAWENDVVAFRMYGKALEGRADNAQGTDFWAKRTEKLIINKWYLENDYHTDHGEGLDYYAVGQTLGAGDLGLYLGDSVRYTKHYRAYEVLDNGPIRTTFKLTFERENIHGQNISVVKTISLDAGQHFNKIVLAINNEQAKKTPIVVGLVKRSEERPIYLYNKKNKALTYWEPDIKSHGQTGTALIIPEGKVHFIADDKKQFLLRTTATNGKPFVYYSGAAWNKAGKITSAESWQENVQNRASQMKEPLQVTLQ